MTRENWHRVVASAAALAVFLIIFGAKLAVIDRYGSDLPYWDQWIGEGEMTFRPWLERHELWPHVIVPHSEHRIAPTRLLALGLLLASGQWDGRMQCAVNAALHAALAAMFVFWAWRCFSRGWAAAVTGFVTLVVAPPIAWENVLCGFQSQYYFLIGISLLAIWNLLGAPVLSVRWWCGVVCSLIGPVTMGSGALCAVPIIAIACLRLVRSRSDRRAAFANLAVAACTAGLGVWLYAPATHHDSIHAHGIAQFLIYAVRCLAWPVPQWPWMALFFWLPWLAMAVRLRKSLGSKESAIADFVVAGGVWVLLQTAAVSYGRGGGGAMPAARYGDVTGLGVIFSFAALAVLAGSGRRRLVAAAGAVHFLAVAVCATIATVAVVRQDLPRNKLNMARYEHHVAAFLLTDDYEEFARNPADIPFPIPEFMRDLLRRPLMQALMPASVRRPIPLDGFDDSNPIERPLAHRRLRSMAAAGIWRSGILPTGQGWWKIETAGNLGTSGASLKIVAQTGEVLGVVSPSRFAGNSWRAAYVRAPRVPAMLVAEADSAEKWFAFSEPVEMSATSYLTWLVMRNGRWIAFVGLAGLGGTLGSLLAGPKRDRTQTGGHHPI